MILKFEEFKLANDIVEKIVKETTLNNIETELKDLTQNIELEKRKEFFNHLNSLFLNVILNRLDEQGFGNDAKEKAVSARKIINNLK